MDQRRTSSLDNTSVTCILGNQTHSRRWVRYEIIESYVRGNGLLGIYIHKIADKNQKITIKGPYLFDYLVIVISVDGKKLSFLEYKSDKWINHEDCDGYSVSNIIMEHWGISYKLSEIYPTYDWVNDKGSDNLGYWVEKAAKA